MGDKVTIPVESSRLERFMRARGILPKDLSRASGVTRTQLLDYRKNTSSPMISTARRLVKGVRRLGYACTFNDLWPLNDDD
jgi:transcriptional regulator with XRE-family HTH domain